MSGSGVLESDLEDLFIELLKKQDYEYEFGPDIAPDGPRPERSDYREVLQPNRVKSALRRLNPSLSQDSIEDAYRKLIAIQSNSIVEANMRFHDYLCNGVPVEYKRKDGTIKGDRARLVDFDRPENNDFLAVNQFTVVCERNNRRPDLVLFVNGLPVVLFEFKSPGDEHVSTLEAYRQVYETYFKEIPTIFFYNEFIVLSDGLDTLMGTISSDFHHCRPWKDYDGFKITSSDDDSTMETMVRGLLSRIIIVDMLQNFIVYDVDEKGNVVKKAASYHQYRAVNNLIQSVMRASSEGGDGKGGVVWHTQGSGKSLTMVFFAAKVSKVLGMRNPTIVMITDRIDLDGQLFSTFSHCAGLLRQTPQQADSRENLTELLKVATGGIVFTTINKFFPEGDQARYPVLTQRRNVIVMADEAHRSQYELVSGFAAHMREGLPNATFIGFTGTPIDLADRNTVNVFGSYVSIYDIRQSIEDGTTVPIYYDSRLIKFDKPAEEMAIYLDQGFEEVYEDEEASEKERKKSKWAAVEAIVGTESRMDKVAKDIVEHFEARQDVIRGKAMVVCMSRRICVGIYDRIIKLRPEWAGRDDTDSVVNIVMTGSAADPPEWQRHIRNKEGRKMLEARFKDPDDPFRIVIVRDMWLTGFDVPCLTTMYVDKPMQGHTLMQAISRVNRVFGDKPGGLIVDYFGIGNNLAKAVGKYTNDGGSGNVYVDIDEALSVFQKDYEICCDIMHGYDWSWWYTSTRTERVNRLRGPMNYVLSLPDGKKRFKKAVGDMEKAYSLVSTHPEAFSKREGVAFFQFIRSAINKLDGTSKKTQEEKDAAIRQVLDSALSSGEPVDVMKMLGYEKADISILSDEFLERVSQYPERNLAAELLKRLVTDKATSMKDRNIVQSRKFSEMIQESMTKYEKNLIDTTQLIHLLIEMAKEMRDEQSRGAKLGLTSDELAFYDALGTDDAAVKMMGDAVLRQIAMDVAKAVNDNMTIDWNVREQAKAKIRTVVKRLLTKYGYPPDKKEEATKLILEQAEAICSNKVAVRWQRTKRNWASNRSSSRRRTNYVRTWTRLNTSTWSWDSSF